MMPGMNGIEFLSEAKKIQPNASTILLTGYADKENAIKGINEAGLYKYLEKPWDNDELIQNIKNAYERACLIKNLEEKNRQLNEYSISLEREVKERTAELTETNERLSAIINNCADGILVVSFDKTVIDVNPAAESLFGLSENIIKHKKISELVKNTEPEYENVFNKKENSLIRETEIENFVTGKKIPVEISCSYIPPSEENLTSKYVLVIRDTSLQKDSERLREDFIATLTHDLRTPLLAAIQALKFLSDGSLGEINEKQSQVISTMIKSNEDLLGLVNALLVVYKYDASEQELCKTEFCFKSLVDQTYEELKPLADTKKIEFNVDYEIAEETKIYADRGEIRRVICNLCGNAINYTNNGGKVTVTVKSQHKDLLFTVQDNGNGIPQEDIPQLFNRFSQGTNQKRSSSTGLGLYLSRQIIEAHNGKIYVDSKINKGSKFTFELKDSINDCKVIL